VDSSTLRAAIPCVGGDLLPSAYIAHCLSSDARALSCPPEPATLARDLGRIWRRARESTGPATGLRLLFDLIVDPMVTALGFRWETPSFHRQHAEVTLLTPAARPVVLFLLPWTDQPSTVWSEIARAAREAGARWGIILAPPFLSIVPLAERPARRSLDVELSCLSDPLAVSVIWVLVRAEAFDGNSPTDRPFLEQLLERAAAFEDGVKRDLQTSVAEALAALASVMDADTAGRAFAPFTAGPVAPHDQALTLIHRILFLLFAESRGLTPSSNALYRQAYSIGTLGRQVLGGDAAGVWDAMSAITRLARLGSRATALECPPFNGRLFARASAPALERRPSRRGGTRRATAQDAALGRALVALVSRHSPRGRELIDYRDLGVEQLGAVYERLLDVGHVDGTCAPPASKAHSVARKSTGSFYTPQPLAEFVVRRTLAPLVDGASSDQILRLRVVDPSMGSGACLVAACRYLAAAYEKAVVNEARAAAGDFDERERANVRRLVAERCLAGVDRNPTAVELARLSIWLTTLAHGKPLGFLDHQLRVGDSLIGAWPGDLPRLRKGPSGGRAPLPLFEDAELDGAVRQASGLFHTLRFRPDDSVADVHAKAEAWRRLTSDRSALEPWRRAATLWCARWFWPQSDGGGPDTAESRALIDGALGRDQTLPASYQQDRWRAAREAERAHRFFHWPLEFADVFFDADGRPQERGGFDAVIGNPPWEMARRDDHVERHDSALVRYARESGQYPSCGRGHLNLYQAFLDRSIALTRPGGRVGLVLPWSVAIDDGAADLRRRLLADCDLDTLVGLDNARGLFPIHRGLRFAVVAATVGRPTSDIRATFGIKTLEDIDSLPDRDDPTRPAYPIRLSRHALPRIGGPSLRFPDVRHPKDLELLDRLTASFLPLASRDGWRASFGRELNATESRSACGTSGLPVIEGKHLTPFAIANGTALRISRDEALRLLPLAPFDRPRLAYRDVSGVGNTYAIIAAVVPAGVVTTHTLLCLKTLLPIERQHFLSSLLNSFVLNAIVRMLMGNHLTTSLMENLPVPRWTGDSDDRRIAAVAAALAQGHRSSERGWLQAAVAKKYDLTRDEFRHILDRAVRIPEVERNAAWWEFVRAPARPDRPNCPW
jgi:hypothetical protein